MKTQSRSESQMFAVIVADALAATYPGANIDPRKPGSIAGIRRKLAKAGLLADMGREFPADEFRPGQRVSLSKPVKGAKVKAGTLATIAAARTWHETESGPVYGYELCSVKGWKGGALCALESKLALASN